MLLIKTTFVFLYLKIKKLFIPVALFIIVGIAAICIVGYIFLHLVDCFYPSILNPKLTFGIEDSIKFGILVLISLTIISGAIHITYDLLRDPTLKRFIKENWQKAKRIVEK